MSALPFSTPRGRLGLAAALGSWPLVLPVAVLLGAGYGFCLTSGLATVARLATGSERGALTGTFYACAYLGFGVPFLLSAPARDGTPAAPLAGLAVVTALVAAALALPATRRLVA